MSEITGGLPQPIILQAVRQQSTAEAGPFIQAQGKLVGEKPGDILDFSYRQGKVAPENKRKEHFAKAGEHLINNFKYVGASSLLAGAAYALVGVSPPLALGLGVGALGLHVYGGLAHGWPGVYHGVKGAMTPNPSSSV